MLKSTCILLLGFAAVARTEMEGFIVGGQHAKIEYHPYSVFLDINCATPSGKKMSWICGASVINQLILLSAAHCLYGCSEDSHVKLNLGSEYRDRGQEYSAIGYTVHENYDTKTSSNDICLLKVERPVSLNRKVSRVALLRNPPYTENAKVAGWGVFDEQRGRQSDRLKFIQQRVLTRTECLRTFRYLARGTLCATADIPTDYAAQGDSGSALVVRGYIQIGLVSYKIPSISKNIIIYTDIGYFYDWIKSNSRVLHCY